MHRIGIGTSTQESICSHHTGETGPIYRARGLISSLSAYCSIAWAIQPTVRPKANRAIELSGGRSSARVSVTNPKSKFGYSPVKDCAARTNLLADSIVDLVPQVW